jgi:hypothetical protein
MITDSKGGGAGNYTSFGHQFPPGYNRLVLTESSMPFSEQGGVQRLQRLSILRPTPINLWDTGQTKDDLQSRHHANTTDHYYGTVTYAGP